MLKKEYTAVGHWALLLKIRMWSAKPTMKESLTNPKSN